MFKFLKEIKDSLTRIESVVSHKENDGDNIVELTRHLLGSISLSDIRDKGEMTDEERLIYLNKVATIYESVIQPTIKKMIIAQQEFMANEADGIRQIDFSRGTINGLMLVMDKFRDSYNEYLELTRPPETFDRNKIMDSLIVK